MVDLLLVHILAVVVAGQVLLVLMPHPVLFLVLVALAQLLVLLE
jgi:hypothetical protein